MKGPSECRCRCHSGAGQYYCCPECEPEAYDLCARCSTHRYQHNEDEREGSTGACESFLEVPS
jgi:hypothetical protein